MKERLKRIPWFGLEFSYAIGILAPDIGLDILDQRAEIDALIKNKVSDNDPRWDEPMVEEQLHRLYSFAVHMVRYATSPRPDDSYAQEIGIKGKTVYLINPDTDEPFTLEDLIGDRTRAIGSTAWVEDRLEVVYEVTIALYRILPLGSKLVTRSSTQPNDKWQTNY